MTRGPLKTESRFRSSLLYFVAGICLAYSSPGWAGSPALPEKTLVPSATRSYMVPLSFEANQGQVDEQVKYLARGQGYSLFLTPGAAVLGLRSEGAGQAYPMGTPCPARRRRFSHHRGRTACRPKQLFCWERSGAMADQYPHFCPRPLPASLSRRGFDLLRPARTAGK